MYLHFVLELFFKVKSQGAGCLLEGSQVCLLDYETKPSHDIIIEAQDNGIPKMATKVMLTILLKDVNDPPFDLSVEGINLTENAVVGTLIATVKVL